MRRLHTAALAAFLTCTCAGAAQAYYFAACTLSGVTGSIGFNTVFGAHFVVPVSGTCSAAGTAQCCYQTDVDLLQSTDGGATWHQESHAVKQHAIDCGKGFSLGDDTYPPGPGLFRLQAKIESCSGALIKDLGHLDHQF